MPTRIRTWRRFTPASGLLKHSIFSCSRSGRAGSGDLAPMTSRKRAPSTLDRARRLQLFPNTVQHTINKLRRLRRRKLARDLDGLINDNGARSSWITEHLCHRSSQYVPIDRGHPINPPIRGVRLDQLVDIGAAVLRDTEYIFREALHFALDIPASLPKCFADVVCLLLAEICLIEHLQSEFA